MPTFTVKLVPKDLMPLWEEFWDGDGSLASPASSSSRDMAVVRTVEIVAASDVAAGTLAEARTPGYLALRGVTELVRPE